MIVGVVGAGGGVGTSTLALLLSTALCEQRSGDAHDGMVLVEADRSGGVFSARYEIGNDTGLGSWIAGLAANPQVSVAAYGKRPLPGLRIVPGAAGWVDAERELSAQGIGLVTTAMRDDLGRDWVIDLGRGGSVVAPLAAEANVVVVVCSGRREEVVGLVNLVRELGPARCVVALGNQGPDSADAVRDFCGAATVVATGVASIDADGAVRVIEGHRRGRNKSWRAALACRDAVTALVDVPPMLGDERRSAS